jgi:hypothetical protein
VRCIYNFAGRLELNVPMDFHFPLLPDGYTARS